MAPHPEDGTQGSIEPRFPGFDVLGQRRVWDDVTAAAVLARVAPREHALQFFAAARELTVRALVARLLALDDGPDAPVVEMIDERLAQKQGDGYRHEDMPEDWDAWARSLEAIDADARELGATGFADLDRDAQIKLLESIRTASAPWHGLPADRVFQLWLRYACTAFYSHPHAWNEIGFGGPAYPRGYKNVGIGRREPFEVEERDSRDPVPWAQRVERARAGHPVDPPASGSEVRAESAPAPTSRAGRR